MENAQKTFTELNVTFNVRILNHVFNTSLNFFVVFVLV